nr:uncharacterized protein CI109_000483 [Kwoniella shandongensis]KAA5530912.1 hypothetical protein CI109_000483 [Kwoniella shandongensis]
MSQHLYTPPSNASSRWVLGLRAKALRAATGIAFGINYLASPDAVPATSTEWIDAILGESKAKKAIRLDIYQPSNKEVEGSTRTDRPGMIVFHGGGFVLGSGTDDALWAATANDQLGAVVIAVSYRLAPECPFPVPVEDCASAILHVSANAARYGIDPSQLVISGFSAGGNLAFSSNHLLHHASKWYYTLPTPLPRIRGIVAFYPLLDYSLPREAKRATCVKPEFTLPDSLTNLFDTSYLTPSLDLLDPRVSPSIASDELIDSLPPVHLVLCEYDMLHAEGLDFKKRLETRGNDVTCREVKGEKHGWDKPPPFAPKSSVVVEYTEALSVVKRWLSESQDQ